MSIVSKLQFSGLQGCSSIRSNTVKFSGLTSVKRSKVFKVKAERDYTGFVEKDTAGQTNIYAVEPTIYVAESPISTNSRGQSTDGTSGTLIIAGFLAAAALSGAAIVLLTVNNAPKSADEVYQGPPLDFYIQKFSHPELEEELLEAPAVLEVTAIVEDASEVAPVTVIEIVEDASEVAPVTVIEIVEDASPSAVLEAPEASEAPEVTPEVPVVVDAVDTAPASEE